MTPRVDVSDLHALIALVCGGVSLLFTLGCLIGVIPDNRDAMPVIIAGAMAVGLWCGLFALVLRGTLFTRVAAALGVVATVVAVCVGSCAGAVQWG